MLSFLKSVSKGRSAALQPEVARRVLVCGASGAIGSAVAEAFAANGASVALHAFRNEGAVRALAERAATLGAPSAAVLLGDLSNAAEARRIVTEAAQALQGLDALVLAVGSAEDQPLFMMQAGAMHKAMQDNLAPVVHACEAFRDLRAGQEGGAVVVVSSITGSVGQPMRTAYGAAKAAVDGYIRSFAREVAPQGMTANCIAPQVIEGGLADLMKARIRSLLRDNTPLARACEAHDVAGPAVFLASGGARYITGTVLNVTGGMVTW